MARRLPQLNALRAFEAAARHLSFVRAAAELHVTPAAISQQVRSLEQQLGVLLFRRLTRGISLTDAGRALLPGVTDGLDRLAQAAADAAGGGVRGRLIVSVLPSFCRCWLVPRLGRFTERYPDLELDIRAEARRVDFDTEAVDMAIRHGDGRYPGLRSDLLMTEEVFPVCSPALLGGPKPLRRLADLRHHTLLHDGSSGINGSWLSWAPWLELAGLSDVDPERGPRFSDSAMILQAAVAGQGVAIGRSVLLGSDLCTGRLVRPFDIARPAGRAYYILAPEITADIPKVAAFRDWLFGEAADTFAGIEPAAAGLDGGGEIPLSPRQ
jgi:LysR family glycine cleavage system transcriptional activator